MKKLLFVLFLFPCYSFGQYTINADRLDSALTALHELHLFNGTVLVAKEGEILYEKSLGNSGANSDVLLTGSSAYNLASVSKQFYTMMIMILKEEGKLEYDDPAQQYLPTFPYPEVTIRQLMNQISGVPEYFEIAGRQMNLLDTLTNESLLEILAIKKPPLVFEPGERWQYSNTNYTTLASIVTTVSGQHPADFFKQKIARPLGLDNTYVYNLKMGDYPSSRVFGLRYEGGEVVPNDLVRFDGIMGDGNIYASARDLLKWDQALYTEKLVSQETMEEALRPGVLNNGDPTRYGFGWSIQERGRIYSHTGGWVGFRTIIVRNTDLQETFIMLTNGSDGSARRVVEDILGEKPAQIPHSELIKNVRVIDGTGTAEYQADVRILRNRIREIGILKAAAGELVTDGAGLVLAPGFIDSHSHHDWGLDEHPSCIPATSQGITTIVIGQDGGSKSIDSIRSSISQIPAAINIASFTGHTTLRSSAMDGDIHRKANKEEVEAMKEIFEYELEKGSLGLSTGLEYEGAFYSNSDEVIELAKVASAQGGRYISHMRSEDIFLDEAIDEIIDIGYEADIPVQISHFKIARRSRWGTSVDILRKLQEARQYGVDITADVYPYTMWSSTPRVLFPNKDFDNPQSALFATKELFDPDKSIMVRFSANPEYVGKTITEIGQLYDETPDQGLMRVIREGEEAGTSGNIVATSMSEKDVSTFMKWAHSSICSDGARSGHPRGHGAFTRVLGRYVREMKLMSLEEAIHKMTGLPAENLGLEDRGMLLPGYFADLVLFDPDVVIDEATIANPTALSKGIEKVWVNGERVFEDKEAVLNFPGQFIRRGGQ